MAQPRPSGMAHNQTGTSAAYQQSIFSVPLSQQSVVSTTPVPSGSFTTPQILYPGTLPISFRPIIPMNAPGFHHAPYQGASVNLHRGMMGPYACIPSTTHVSAIQNSRKRGSPVQDSQALMEDRKKFDKERQFQLQQQKLKQFSSSGMRTNLNTDTLIENMFGKTEKVNRAHSNASVSQPIKIATPPPTEQETHSMVVQEIPVQITAEPPVHKNDLLDNKLPDNKQNLDRMMQRCSDFTGPQKARTFQKPAVKDMKVREGMSLSQNLAFASSQKSRDWSRAQGLEDVFSVPKARFPAWCTKEWVPPLYHQIEQYVTEDGQHSIDTNRLYPVLLSSGLPRELLGHIWNLVNTTEPGQLSQEECYAALALIAVAQSGCPVASVDILHSLPRPPVPVLSPNQTPPDSTAVAGKSQPLAEENFSMETIGDSGWPDDGHSEETNQPVTPTGTNSQFEDDDFGDFCSVATSASSSFVPSPSTLMPSEPANSVDCEDYEDFQQAAPFTEIPENSEQLSLRRVNDTNSVASSSGTIGLFSQKLPFKENAHHLLNPELEDKYSVFRHIEQDNVCTHQANDASDTSTDDFGDFLTADVALANVPPAKDDFPGFCAFETADKNFPPSDGFADFNAFQFTHPPVPLISEVTMPDNFDAEDFGDFASSQQTCDSLTVESHRYQKDNISLGETQSISSLDLGLYASETVQYCGEGLTRQGSIPSLDLRPSALDDADNGNIEETRTSPIQNKTVQKSPPSIEDFPLSTQASTFRGSYPNAAPLIDKYSFIRHETESCVAEDKVCFEWLKCLRSCNELMQNANHMFEQMSNNQVMTEVLRTEEGQDYVKNVIEVYRVAERIHQSSTAVGKQTELLHQVSSSIQQAWNHLTSFLASTHLMPAQDNIDFSLALPIKSESAVEACGVCLLNVDSPTIVNPLDQDKLLYGGRQYHSTCANLWVNCVDLLLPALPMPQLL